MQKYFLQRKIIHFYWSNIWRIDSLSLFINRKTVCVIKVIYNSEISYLKKMLLQVYTLKNLVSKSLVIYAILTLWN